MKLKELLNGIYRGSISPDFANVNIQGICCDSRHARKGCLFVALRGPRCDGSDFIKDAVKKGACVIVAPPSYQSTVSGKSVCLLTVADTKKFLLDVSQRFYDFPSQKIKVVGITGTNGKTTISYLLESVLRAAKKRCAVIGTISHRIDGKTIPSHNTTPGLLENQKYLADMAGKKIDFCAMEVSSHALDQGRVEGIDFASAIFTNLTGDHMDYHANMENYFLAKSKLFTSLKPHAFAIINKDDDYGRRLIKLAKGKVVAYGLTRPEGVTAKDIRLSLQGTSFSIQFPDGEIAIETQLIGRHNIYNILAVSACCLSLGIDPQSIRKGIAALKCVPGRLEKVDGGQNFHVFVDYAHTDDALKNVLSSLKNISQSKIILVFGCGGDRDKTKRPRMGKVAGELADTAIITSDNPRSEDPKDIIKDVVAGYQGKNYQVIVDRKVAIHSALSLAKKGDVVLIAGKGHEDYQIFKDETIHFDDREIVI